MLLTTYAVVPDADIVTATGEYPVAAVRPGRPVAVPIIVTRSELPSTT